MAKRPRPGDSEADRSRRAGAPGPTEAPPEKVCLLRVKVTPRAPRNAVSGWQADGRLAVRTTAPPEKGRANEAVLRFLAGELGVPRRAVTLAAGGARRLKTIRIAGLTEDEVRSRLGRKT